MFYVLTKRAFKVARTPTGQFDARTGTQTEWHLSGPFSKKPLAERTAAAALGTHTCLTARVHTEEELRRIVAKTDGDYTLDRVIREHFRVMGVTPQ